MTLLLNPLENNEKRLDIDEMQRRYTIGECVSSTVGKKLES
jgi:hypothetical protein